jgi:hypothetical protein
MLSARFKPGVNTDAHLARLGFGRWHLVDAQNFGTAGFMEADGTVIFL